MFSYKIYFRFYMCFIYISGDITGMYVHCRGSIAGECYRGNIAGGVLREQYCEGSFTEAVLHGVYCGGSIVEGLS